MRQDAVAGYTSLKHDMCPFVADRQAQRMCWLEQCVIEQHFGCTGEPAERGIQWYQPGDTNMHRCRSSLQSPCHLALCRRALRHSCYCCLLLPGNCLLVVCKDAEERVTGWYSNTFCATQIRCGDQTTNAGCWQQPGCSVDGKLVSRGYYACKQV
jgi:hypothetical protein